MSRGINHRWTRMDTDKVGVGLSFWGVWADPPPRRPRGSLFSILIANSPLAYYYVGWRAIFQQFSRILFHGIAKPEMGVSGISEAPSAGK